MARVRLIFPGQNINQHERSLCSLPSSPSLPPVVRLIRHTLISLLFSILSDFFSDSKFLPRVFFLPLCKNSFCLQTLAVHNCGL